MFEILIRPIDNFLNRVTMYKLVQFSLFAVWLNAFILTFFGLVPFSWLELLLSSTVILISCWGFNELLGKIFRVPVNTESVYITWLILSLILTHTSELGGLGFLVLVSAIAMGSKFIIVFRGKHIFNPSGVAVLITYFAVNQGASWWVGNFYLLPLVVIIGLLIARKTQRFHLILTFIVVNLATLVIANPNTDALLLVRKTVLDSSLIFFACVMLTEPFTSPATIRLRMMYGALVAFLAGLSFNIGPVYASPELALIIGNIFSFIVSPKGRLKLTLKSKSEIGKGVYSFIFSPDRKFKFLPGQYLEWTMYVPKVDLRGNRRFFTIASSPTENEVQLGVKFYDQPSTFKQELQSMKVGEQVFAGQLAGEFTLPANQNQKLIFIAGGIGITPFRSMLKFLIDEKQHRPITLFYSAQAGELVYQDILEQAKSFGVNVFTTTEVITREMIEKAVPDFSTNSFYISGPRGMVVAFEDILKQMGVARSQIKIDFFPGYA